MSSAKHEFPLQCVSIRRSPLTSDNSKWQQFLICCCHLAFSRTPLLRSGIVIAEDTRRVVPPSVLIIFSEPNGTYIIVGQLSNAYLPIEVTLSGKSSREPMCLRAMSGGVRRARWTQIGAIARANMPWSPLEWRLPCQMNCRNVRVRAPTGLSRPCVAVLCYSAIFQQNIALADVPWSAVWRGSGRSMDTNRCHRAS